MVMTDASQAPSTIAWAVLAAFFSRSSPRSLASTGRSSDVSNLLPRRAGLRLSDDEAFSVLQTWNARCEPPWSEGQLLEKVQNARRYGREPYGGLLGESVLTHA